MKIIHVVFKKTTKVKDARYRELALHTQNINIKKNSLTGIFLCSFYELCR